jgi:transcriptional regulator with XRE-family HTH domain
MKDRIKKVMDESGLSASKFADKIGVPRSGLSHVLSGRNKPSLDYVLKILNAFPEIDPYWLIKGQKSNASIRRILEAETNITEEENKIPDLNQSLASVNKKMEVQADKMVSKITKEQSRVPISGQTVSNSSMKEKSVERIVYFYSDGTFREYRADIVVEA